MFRSSAGPLRASLQGKERGRQIKTIVTDPNAPIKRRPAQGFQGKDRGRQRKSRRRRRTRKLKPNLQAGWARPARGAMQTFKRELRRSLKSLRTSPAA
eukprot:821736-Pyramimonas_sp.AAC.1